MEKKDRIAELKEYIRRNGQVKRAVAELAELESSGHTTPTGKVAPPPPKLPPIKKIIHSSTPQVAEALKEDPFLDLSGPIVTDDQPLTAREEITLTPKESMAVLDEIIETVATEPELTPKEKKRLNLLAQLKALEDD